MKIEKQLEALNESEVLETYHDLSGSLNCIETVETSADFIANLDSAIAEAETLIEQLKILRKVTR